MPGSARHQVLIVGGGSAGITVAAILKRRAPGVDIAIVEPSPDHYYQPALTLVGAGLEREISRSHRRCGSQDPGRACQLGQRLAPSIGAGNA